jgi:glucokinase
MQATNGLADLVMVADIGGTNARFALADLQTLELSHIRQMLCGSHPTVEAALDDYLSGLPVKPKSAVLAVAAPVSGGEVRLTNSRWRFVTDELRFSAGFTDIHVVNDFEALALSLPTLEASELHQLGGTVPVEFATKVVLGPGTGLGVAGLLWSGERWMAMPGEGGHMSLGAQDEKELVLMHLLLKAGAHPSAEEAISGPGLVQLYRAVAASRNVTAAKAINVVEQALGGDDAVAQEALQLFIAWLGRFAGNIALAFGARGGVYIGGGIAPKITSALSTGSFRAAFEQKGRMAEYLAPIPVYVILAEFAALKGAAAAFRGRSVHGAIA